MPNIATSWMAPILGQRVRWRGPAWLLYRSYGNVRCSSGTAVKTVTTKYGDRFHADLSSYLEWHLWAFGAYEEQFAELFGHLLDAEDTCLDVGSNIGIHAIRLAKIVGPLGSVKALEADHIIAERARCNVRLNDLSNVEVIEAAAAITSDRVVELYRPADGDPNRGLASLLPHAHLTGKTIPVQTVAIDDVCDVPIKLIKIDVEGLETSVLEGAIRTIEEYRPHVVFEYDPQLFEGADVTAFDLLSNRGYEFLEITRPRRLLRYEKRLVLKHLKGRPLTRVNILAICAARISDIAQFVERAS